MQICKSSLLMAAHSGFATMLIATVASLLIEPVSGMANLRAAAQGAKDLQPFPTAAPVQVIPPDPSKLPKAGDLVAEVKVQLASDHQALGKVSAALMQVQSSVDKTEQSMLGKVLDMQTARSFFGRHAEINTANDEMHEEVSKLNDNVERLSKTLYKTQKQFLGNGHEYRGEEGKLHEEIVEDESMIQNMNAELAKEDDVEKALKRLTKIHNHLLSQAAEAKSAGEKAQAMLKTERQVSHTEAGKHKSLRDQLVKMNNYSVACHGKVEKQSKKLAAALMAESKDNKAAIMTMKQKQKATIATEQRLLAERALLVSEVRKYENEEKEEMERVRDLREDMANLQEKIVKEVRDLQAEILAEKERIKTLSNSLMENAQAVENDMAAKKAGDEQIANLQKQVHDEQNPVIVATIEGQNDALHAELLSATGMWKTVKTQETKANINLGQAKADIGAAQNAEAMADKELATAHRESEKSLAAAVKEAMASKQKSQAIIQRAQDALLNKCKDKWDARSKAKNKKLKQCKRMKDELGLEKAKKESLEMTLKAKAEAGP